MDDTITKELLNQREIFIHSQKGYAFNSGTYIGCEKGINKIDEQIQIIVDKQLLAEQSGYQLCPKCIGDGNLGRYNSPAISSTTSFPVCDVCNGKKIINKQTGLPSL